MSDSIEWFWKTWNRALGFSLFDPAGPPLLWNGGKKVGGNRIGARSLPPEHFGSSFFHSHNWRLSVPTGFDSRTQQLRMPRHFRPKIWEQLGRIRQARHSRKQPACHFVSLSLLLCCCCVRLWYLLKVTLPFCFVFRSLSKRLERRLPLNEGSGMGGVESSPDLAMVQDEQLILHHQDSWSHRQCRVPTFLNDTIDTSAVTSRHCSHCCLVFVLFFFPLPPPQSFCCSSSRPLLSIDRYVQTG